ncbi:MAG: FecR family protein [Cyclobacteriaceae bacterium]
MDQKKDDTFLSRWLNQELSEEELKEFQSSKEYPQYEKILLGSNAIETLDFDIEGALNKIKASKNEKPVINLNRKLWIGGIAASLALLIGFFFLLKSETTITTSFGEQTAFQLPDDSEVTLNANSVISYADSDWEDSRKLELEGEAFFSVKKGKRFTVETTSGAVTVLGTKFNVQIIEALFEVVCYEGKVMVSQNDTEYILTPGKAFRLIGDVPSEYSTGSKAPGWKNHESTFESLPLKYVLVALENQFNIQFDGAVLDQDLLFSGSFPHSDMELALKIVFEPLQVDYTIKDNTVFLEN